MYLNLKSYVATTLTLALTAQAQYQADNPTPPIVACTGQGPGSCNLGIVGYNFGGSGVGTIGYNWATIYDHSCNPIGEIHGEIANAAVRDNGVAIYSQLPWTVIIYHAGDRYNNDYFEFAYAAYRYNGEFACSYQSAYGSNFNVCQHGFPC